MRFEVPQFIDVEDKLFGPLTFTQFVYLAGAGGISFALWAYLPFIVAVVFIIPIAMFGIALAFYKHNNRPFIVLVESWFNYSIKGKKYIWQKRQRPVDKEMEEIQAVAHASNRAATVYVPKISDSKLKDLSWTLDVKEARRGEVL